MDVIVAGQELAKPGQVGRGVQGQIVQPAQGIAALLLGQLSPFRDALQVLGAFLQAPLLLLGQGDDGVAHPALEVGKQGVEVGAMPVKVFLGQALRQGVQFLGEVAAQVAGHAGVGQGRQVTAMGLEVAQGGVEPVVERALDLQRPLQVVIEG